MENKEKKFISKGDIDFAYGKDGMMYRVWELEDLRRLYHGVLTDDVIKETHCSHNLYDLFTGKEFLSMIEDGGIIDYDGDLCNIFVDGYNSNLGIVDKGFCQGKFLVTTEIFRELCDKHDINVNWANK